MSKIFSYVLWTVVLFRLIYLINLSLVKLFTETIEIGGAVISAVE